MLKFYVCRLVYGRLVVDAVGVLNRVDTKEETTTIALNDRAATGG